MVFGETRYAEFQGDRGDVALDDPSPTMRRLDALFAYGFGLTARDRGELARLPEERGADVGDRNVLFAPA